MTQMKQVSLMPRIKTADFILGVCPLQCIPDVILDKKTTAINAQIIVEISRLIIGERTEY